MFNKLDFVATLPKISFFFSFSLRPIELMKNTILARAEQNGLSTDDCYDKWQELLENISDDYATQERFFRHYYNAYKNKINALFRKELTKKVVISLIIFSMVVLSNCKLTCSRTK